MNGYIIIGIAAFCLATGLFVGWHGHTWYDGYKSQQAAVVAEKNAQVGEQNIIKFDQNFTRETKNAPDKCLNAPLPANVRKLLH